MSCRWENVQETIPCGCRPFSGCVLGKVGRLYGCLLLPLWLGHVLSYKKVVNSQRKHVYSTPCSRIRRKYVWISERIENHLRMDFLYYFYQICDLKDFRDFSVSISATFWFIWESCYFK